MINQKLINEYYLYNKKNQIKFIKTKQNINCL